MQTNIILATAVFLTTVLSGFGQPTTPGISISPANQMAYIGSTATFSVAAVGSHPLKYQWRFNDVDLPEKTNNTLKLLNVQFSNAGAYSVLVSYEIQSSPDLTRWSTWTTTNITESSVQISDPASARRSHGFYRVLRH